MSMREESRIWDRSAALSTLSTIITKELAFHESYYKYVLVSAMILYAVTLVRTVDTLSSLSTK